MRLLLDTHVFLWFVSQSSRIPPRALEAILDAGNQRWLSLASIWEMAVKTSIGKLDLGVALDELVESQAIGNGIRLLPIERAHVSGVALMPLLHRDPFDRLLVAQARSAGLDLVSGDAGFDAYGVARCWA